MKIEGVKGLNWLLYYHYCTRLGIAPGQYKNFKIYIEERLKK